MKKMWTLIFAMMLVMALCVSAFAADSDFKHMSDYFAVGKYSGSGATEIVVPAKLNGEDTPIFYSDSISMNAIRGVTTITLSEGITQLRDMNIYSADALTKVSLPDTLEVIGRRNFYQSDALKEITIPASVAYVGQDCFSYCDVLTKVTFTGLCPVFGVDCFKSAAADLVISVPSDQVDAYKAALPEGLNIQSSGKKAVVSRSKVTEKDFTFDSATGTITGYTGRVGCIEIPATIGGVQVKAIGKEAFFKNPFIMAVTLPEGLETIELSAFAGSVLARVNFPSTLKTISKYAFNGVKLDSLILAEGLETIGDSAFTSAFGSNKIPEIVIPNTVTTIGKKAFNANRAKRIVFGENVQNVGSEAFASSSELTEIVILNKNMVTFAGDAFTKCTKEATLTLPDGISQDVYNEYVSLMPMLFPTCAVIEPANMEMGFPQLDVMAGMPFFGEWHDVAGLNVMEEFTDEYPSTKAILNPDGTGTVVVDDDEIAFGWYVEEGYALLAPVENGKPNGNNIFCFASIDENGRLVMDYGYAAAICEQEGKVYAVPAVPEIPLPDFNLDNAKYFIGKWEAVSYTMDGATYDAATVGPMLLILNEDGTAQSIEAGEEPYELRWAAEYAVAYVGETMNTAAKITFDGTGNIVMEQDGASILLKPYVDVKVIEGADELLGEWYDDIGNKLTLVNDGTMTVTYASDGWTYEDSWDMVDGSAVVTAGRWEGASIYLSDGIVFIDNDEGIFQLFSADGDLSAYYGDEEEEMPEAIPVGPEGEPYFGAWEANMGGMKVVLTLNQDGTCTMSMFGETDESVWTMENGRAYVAGEEVSIDAAGQLIMPSSGMTFVKAEDGATTEEMSEEEMLIALLAAMAEMEGMEGETAEASESGDPYIGVKFEMTGSIVQGVQLTAEQLGCAGDYVIFNADGSAELVMSGIPVQTLGWTRGTVNVLGTDYDGFCIDYYGTYYNFAITEEGLLMDYFGMLRTYERVEGAAAPASAAQEDPYIGKKFLMTGSIVQGIHMTAAQLGCAGDYVIFNADGSAELVMSGIPVQTLGWTRGTVNVLGTDYDGFSIDYYGTYYNFAITEEGLLMDYFGMLRTYERE